MDIFQVIFGRYLIEFLGASLRFMYINLFGFIRKKKYVSFSTFFSPKVSVEKGMENESFNRMLELIFCNYFHCFSDFYGIEFNFKE